MTSFIVYTQKTLLVNGYPYVSKANKYVCTDAMYTYLPTNLPTYPPTNLPISKARHTMEIRTFSIIPIALDLFKESH